MGGNTVKNVQDYDNTRLMAGSWGSLGIITRIVLKLRPLPEKETTVFLAAADLKAAIDAGRTIRNETLPIALELLDGVAMAVLARAGYQAGKGGAGILALFNGFKEQVDAQVAYLQERFPAVTILDEATAAAAWQARRRFLPVYAGAKGAVLASVALPFTALEEFLTRARAELDQHRQEAAMIAHFGNAHVHIFLDAAPATWAEVRADIDRLASLADSLGGLLIVDNIDDTTLTRRRVEARGQAVPELLRRLKSAFDPHLIMTPNSKVLAYVIDSTRAAS
jgi:FAD/FMN-containing dehydrogenase